MVNLSHDAIVIILDIGKSVAVSDSSGDKTFFARSKECVSWIIQRNLISRSSDVLSLVLIGSDEANGAWSASGYDNVTCKFDLQHASWEMLKFIDLELKSTENESNWMGALVVSLETLKVYEEFNNVQNKKIVFFSDFAYYASDDHNIIVKGLRELKANVIIIGPDSISRLSSKIFESQEIIDQESQESQTGKDVIAQLLTKLPEQIVICSFETVLKQLCSYKRKVCRKTPWNCLLDIGDVKINISMFLKTNPKSGTKFNSKYMKPVDTETEGGEVNFTQGTSGETIPVIRDKVMHYKHDMGPKEEPVDVEVKSEDTVEGYRYGITIIPFSDEDKAVMNYKPGPKSFSVIGFTPISSVPFYLLTGECSYVVLPREKDEHAEVALSAIIQGMKEMQFLAVVRRVYSNDRGLSLGVLYPFIEEIYNSQTDEVFYKECLIYVDLAFEEELKSINFPSLDKVAKDISEEQFDAVDALIDEMDLMKAETGPLGEPCEAFEATTLHDVKEQFFHYCVIQRGLYPEKPLPRSLPQYIENYIKIPQSIKSKMQGPLHNIKKLFQIIHVRRSEKRDEEPTGSVSLEMFTSEDAEGMTQHFNQSFIDEEENLLRREIKKLFAKGFPEDEELDYFLHTSSEVADSQDVLEAFHEVIQIVRNQYIGKNPDHFNWWMARFKSFANERSHLAPEIWNIIVSESLGLISEKENQYSRVSESQAEDFLIEQVTKSLSCHTPKKKRSDFQPLPEGIMDLLNEQNNRE